MEAKTKVRVEFETREYVFSHGRSPKGFGSWCFEFEGHQFWAHQKSYGDAKKACVEAVRVAAEGSSASFVVVKVCS